MSISESPYAYLSTSEKEAMVNITKLIRANKLASLPQLALKSA
jgi:hypothetical protein